MGLFTSECKECFEPIHWFLDVPQDYKCPKCNTYNPPEHIEKSWQEDYSKRQEIMKYYGGELTKEQVMGLFKNDDHALRILETQHWSTKTEIEESRKRLKENMEKLDMTRIKKALELALESLQETSVNPEKFDFGPAFSAAEKRQKMAITAVKKALK